MNKVALIFLLMVFLLIGCQVTDSNTITLEETLSSFEEQEMSLIDSKVNDKNIFVMKLNGVRPSVYELDGKMLSVYIYDSTKERENGLEDFRKKTELANLISYKVYEVKNVILFYVYEKNLNSEIDSKIQNVVSKLSEG
ncbi:hypothetical protein [Psychrobacillus sp. L3]|uniref:hypothetical protein n=1 Tax=Psychrobacillus sp. L3 TaxID=3236891 RepID=UPI0036F44E7F